jgi:hypothetical protein
MCLVFYSVVVSTPLAGGKRGRGGRLALRAGLPHSQAEADQPPASDCRPQNLRGQGGASEKHKVQLNLSNYRELKSQMFCIFLSLLSIERTVKETHAECPFVVKCLQKPPVIL